MLRRVVRGIAAVVVAALTLLVAVGLAPFALREQSSDGAVADTATELPGAAGSATDGLRRLGYSCSDPVTSSRMVARSCSRVQWISRARVQMVLAPGTGTVQSVHTSIDQGRSSRTAHREVLQVLAEALGLLPDDQARLVSAATGREAQLLDFGTVTARVHPGAAPESTLRAANSPGRRMPRSPTTLRVPVDAWAEAARSHGYRCSTPQVGTIRSCQRSDNGYHYDLGLQGTDAYTTSVYLSVSSTYHTRTRDHWLEEMGRALGWVDTGQTRSVRTWLADSVDAPGAEGYVDGLPVTFLVRHDAWTKETFGGIAAECAVSIDDLSGCGP